MSSANHEMQQVRERQRIGRIQRGDTAVSDDMAIERPIRRKSRRGRSSMFGIVFAVVIVTICTGAALAAIYTLG